MDIDSMVQEEMVKERPFVVLAHKQIRGMNIKKVHGILRNGGTLPIDDKYSLEVVLLGDYVCDIQIRVHDEGKAPLKQTYHRTKKVVEKVEVAKKVKKEDLPTTQKKTSEEVIDL